MINVALGIVIGVFILSILVFPSTPSHLRHAGMGWYRSTFDVTDDLRNKKRSGLKVLIDYQTGVHYVANPFGGMTVRVDVNGKPIVDKRYRREVKD